MLLAPDFFLAGAPRCGTTALSAYLSDHPDVCFSRPKEPHFFMTDMPAMRAFSDKSSYLDQCFGHCDAAAAKAVGEGSVWYLYSDEAIDNILRERPDARFIVMLRNPVEMVPSFHQKAVESLDEDVTDFAVAWSLQPERRRGRRIPARCRDRRLLDYTWVGRLGVRVAAIRQRIPAAQLMLILYDDFAEDSLSVFRQTLDFLGLPDDGRRSLPRINEHRRVRSRLLLAFAKNPPVRMVQAVDLLKRAFGIERLGLIDRLWRSQLVPASRPPLSPDLRRELLATFSDDIDLLGELLERDLGHWKTADGSSRVL